jgi:hypothetical protein
MIYFIENLVIDFTPYHQENGRHFRYMAGSFKRKTLLPLGKQKAPISYWKEAASIPTDENILTTIVFTYPHSFPAADLSPKHHQPISGNIMPHAADKLTTSDAVDEPVSQFERFVLTITATLMACWPCGTDQLQCRRKIHCITQAKPTCGSSFS